MAKEINWKKLRDKFFKECTTRCPDPKSLKKVNLTPHNLFEWFKEEINRELKL